MRLARLTDLGGISILEQILGWKMGKALLNGGELAQSLSVRNLGVQLAFDFDVHTSSTSSI